MKVLLKLATIFKEWYLTPGTILIASSPTKALHCSQDLDILRIQFLDDQGNFRNLEGNHVPTTLKPSVHNPGGRINKRELLK